MKNFSMRAGSSGGVIDNRLVVCGGYFEHETKTMRGEFRKIESYSSCYAYGHENWTEISMQETKWHASAIVLNPSTLWVTGGENRGSHLDTTEFITLDNKTSQRGKFLQSFHSIFDYLTIDFFTGPDLPIRITQHCTVKYNDTMVFLTGGYQNGEESNKTWIINPTKDFESAEGPALPNATFFHSCGKMTYENGTTVLIIAGGRSEKAFFDTVYMLDPSNAYGWIQGPNLPSPRYQSEMLTSPTENGVILVGGMGKDPLPNQESLLKLDAGSTSWSSMPQTLKSNRQSLVALPVPKSFKTNCST